jgi:hypothetical protein
MSQAGRRFVTHRRIDHSGISGTGIVATGIQFHDGQVVLKWLTHVSSLAIYQSIEALEAIHGHNGDTTIEWIDP